MYTITTDAERNLVIISFQKSLSRAALSGDLPREIMQDIGKIDGQRNMNRLFDLTEIHINPSMSEIQALADMTNELNMSYEQIRVAICTNLRITRDVMRMYISHSQSPNTCRHLCKTKDDAMLWLDTGNCKS